MDNGLEAAFACAAEGGHQKGLTKREAFAMAAMPVAFQFYDKGYCGLSASDQPGSKNVTALAVLLADDLLKALGSASEEAMK